MVDAVLFDLDGTLVDTLPLYIQSYDRALKEQGFSFTEGDIIHKCFGKTELAICAELGIPEKVNQFKDAYYTAVGEHHKSCKLFPGVMEVLDTAKAKSIKLGVISFSFRWYIEGMLKQFNLRPYFDIILGFDDVKQAKPAPEAVIVACEKLTVTVEHTFVVGDSKSDILMGKSAHARTILFSPPGNSAFYNLTDQKLVQPDFVIHAYSELLPLL